MLTIYNEPLGENRLIIRCNASGSMVESYVFADELYTDSLLWLRERSTSHESTCSEKSPLLICHSRMSLVSNWKQYRSRLLEHPFSYKVFIHSFYSCYAGVQAEDFALARIPATMIKAMGRRMLCETFRVLSEQYELVKPRWPIVLEADGAGPYSADPNDRRELVKYYMRSFDMVPIIPVDFNKPIHNYVPMTCTVGELLARCG